VIHRTQRSLFWQSVSRGAFELLIALAGGLPLVKSCERAIELVPEEAEAIENQISDWFQDWGKRGWVVDVTGQS
jgi:hypothetical protein